MKWAIVVTALSVAMTAALAALRWIAPESGLEWAMGILLVWSVGFAWFIRDRKP